MISIDYGIVPLIVPLVILKSPCGPSFEALLSGILFLNARLGPGTCSLLQLLSGLSPTIMFAAILVKTRKVYVIFEKQMKDMANR